MKSSRYNSKITNFQLSTHKQETDCGVIEKGVTIL